MSARAARQDYAGDFDADGYTNLEETPAGRMQRRMHPRVRLSEKQIDEQLIAFFETLHAQNRAIELWKSFEFVQRKPFDCCET